MRPVPAPFARVWAEAVRGNRKRRVVSRTISSIPRRRVSQHGRSRSDTFLRELVEWPHSSPGQAQGSQGSRPPLATTPALTMTPSPTSGRPVVIVGAGEDVDVGRGPLWSPSLVIIVDVGRGPLWSPSGRRCRLSFLIIV